MLSARETEMMSFIEDYVSQSGGVSPSYAEAAHALGLKSKGSTSRMFKRLEGKGYLKRLRGKHRALEVLRPARVQYFKFDDEAKELKLMT